VKRLRKLYAWYRDKTVFHFFHFLMKRHLRRWKHVAKRRVLDIGCGQQPYRGIVQHQIDVYIGTNHRTYHGDTDVARWTDVYVNDGAKMPFKGESFDAVLCFQVLPVFPDMYAFLREVKRLLKSGGHFMLTTDFLYPIWNAPYNYWRTTRYALELMAEAVGFEVLAIETFGGYWIMQARCLDRYYSGLLSTFIQAVRRERRVLIRSLKIFRLILFCAICLPLQPVILNAMFLCCFWLDRCALDTDFTTNYLAVLRRK